MRVSREEGPKNYATDSVIKETNMKPPPCFRDPETKKMIKGLCVQNEVDDRLLQDLCEVVEQHAGSGRREGIIGEITECIDRFMERCD